MNGTLDTFVKDIHNLKLQDIQERRISFDDLINSIKDQRVIYFGEAHHGPERSYNALKIFEALSHIPAELALEHVSDPTLISIISKLKQPIEYGTSIDKVVGGYAQLIQKALEISTVTPIHSGLQEKRLANTHMASKIIKRLGETKLPIFCVMGYDHIALGENVYNIVAKQTGVKGKRIMHYVDLYNYLPSIEEYAKAVNKLFIESKEPGWIIKNHNPNYDVDFFVFGKI